MLKLNVSLKILLVDQDDDFTSNSLSSINSEKQSFKLSNNHKKFMHFAVGLNWVSYRIYKLSLHFVTRCFKHDSYLLVSDLLRCMKEPRAVRTYTGSQICASTRLSSFGLNSFPPSFSYSAKTRALFAARCLVPKVSFKTSLMAWLCLDRFPTGLGSFVHWFVGQWFHNALWSGHSFANSKMGNFSLIFKTS